jgi:hypothetical protein
METMKDPEFLEDARRSVGLVGPVSGSDMQRIVAEMYAMPGDVIAKVQQAVGVPVVK